MAEGDVPTPHSPEDPNKQNRSRREGGQQEQGGQHNETPESKFDTLKKHPKIKDTKKILNKYYIEVFYVITIIISVIVGMVNYPGFSLGLTGIGFLAAFFLYDNIDSALHKTGGFIKKQDIVTQSIIGIIAIVLSFFIPYIMLAFLMGIPAGSGSRSCLQSHHHNKPGQYHDSPPK